MDERLENALEDSVLDAVIEMLDRIQTVDPKIALPYAQAINLLLMRLMGTRPFNETEEEKENRLKRELAILQPKQPN